MTDDLKALDQWCSRRLNVLNERSASHIRAGRSVTAPDYRFLLGEHRAYMAVRSYIHGSRASLKEGE